MPNEQQLEALNQIAKAAVAAEAVTQCPAELTAAQCIVESAWLARYPDSNCFGIKATDSNESYSFTREFIDGTWQNVLAAFETFPDLTACFIAHGNLIISGRYYKAAWAQYQSDKDVDALIRNVAQDYATDPGYATDLLELTDEAAVKAALAAARADAQPAKPAIAAQPAIAKAAPAAPKAIRKI